MNKKQDLKNKWVGQFEVRQPDGVATILGKNRGAFVVAIGWCEEPHQFEPMIERALYKLGLIVLNAEDIETCEERLRRTQPPEEFFERLNEVSEFYRVALMDFHTYPLDGEEMSERDYRVIAEVATALLGEVSAALRAVGVTYNETSIHLDCYYDGEISDDDKESMSRVETELISVFPESDEITCKVHRKDHPTPIPSPEGMYFAYHRKEPAVN